jgi:ABC-type antimicrobial peptide transport system permease subunit
MVRGRSDNVSLAPLLRDAVRAIDPDLPLYRIMSMDQAMLDARFLTRLSTTLLDSIALVAVVLASIGLYAVSAHAVMQRRQEIGIRMALGARRGQVAWMIVRRASVQLALGLGVGVLCTLAFEKLVGLGADAFGYRMSDPLTLIAAAAILVIVTALACVAPAYRAARLDPVHALRHE